MKDEDVIIGMKVVPHNKSVGFSTFQSAMSEMNNPEFLYVTKYSDSMDCWELYFKNNHDKEYFYKGYFFNASDFEPYIDPKDILPKDEVIKAFEELKALTSRRCCAKNIEINALINKYYEKFK